MWRIFSRGILRDNPVIGLLLGLCPTLAVTTSGINGLGMGLTATMVLMCSNVTISILKNYIPDTVRIPCFIVVIASFVTIADFMLHAYVPGLHSQLGIFIPLVVVNCIILGRAEGFASKNNVFYSLIDGLGMGIGFTLALVVLGSIREILGNATIFGYAITGIKITPVIVMVLPPGAFITLGFMIAAMRYFESRRA